MRISILICDLCGRSKDDGIRVDCYRIDMGC